MSETVPQRSEAFPDVPERSTTSPDVQVPTLAGTFALYETGDGGLCLVTDIQGRGIERRVIPGKMLKFLTGPGRKMFGKMFGGDLDGDGGSLVE